MNIPRVVLLLCMAGAANAASEDDPVVAEVMARDAEIAAAHGRGDMATYRAALSERYVYVDVGGKRVTPDMLETRRAGDQRRVVTSDSAEEEGLRIADDVVLLRGLEHSVASYYGGLPRVSSSRWTSLWVREDDGVWRIVADTATPVRTSEALPFVPVPQPPATVNALTGRWQLATTPALELQIEARDGALVGRLQGQRVAWMFRPASARHWFADDRPFELRFAPDGATLEMVTWGTATPGRRLAE